MAAPIPDAAPEMMATLPASLIVVSSSIPTVILITKPSFVLGQQATFSHEFETHNDLRPLQRHRQLAWVAKTASADIRRNAGMPDFKDDFRSH